MFNYLTSWWLSYNLCNIYYYQTLSFHAQTDCISPPFLLQKKKKKKYSRLQIVDLISYIFLIDYIFLLLGRMNEPLRDSFTLNPKT